MPVAEDNYRLHVVQRLSPRIRLDSGFILPLSCSCCESLAGFAQLTKIDPVGLSAKLKFNLKRRGPHPFLKWRIFLKNCSSSGWRKNENGDNDVWGWRYMRGRVAFGGDFWRRGPRNSPPTLQGSATSRGGLATPGGGLLPGRLRRDTPFVAGWREPPRSFLLASREHLERMRLPASRFLGPRLLRRLISRGADW